MKKLLFSMSLMLAASALTNCAKDALQDDSTAAGGSGFSFSASIDGLGGSRATLDGLKTVWTDGDQIGFGGIKSTDNYDIARLYGFDFVSGSTFSNATSTFTEPNYFYAVFPVSLESGKYKTVYTSNYATADKVNTTGQYYSVGYDGTGKAPIVQHGASADHVPAYSPMYWMSDGCVSPDALSVTMHHTASLMKFTVENGESGDITVTGLKLSAPADTKICGTYYIDLADGSLAPSGDSYVYSTAAVNVEDAPATAPGGTFDVYMPVAPFSLEAGDKVTIVVTAADGSVCTVEKEISSPLKFEAGKINTATVTFRKDAVSDAVMTVSDLVEAINGGATQFAGRKVQGIVSAIATDSYQNLSYGTLLFTDNTGEENSAVKFYGTADGSLIKAEGLAVGDELLIDLGNADVADRYGVKQISGVLAADIEETVSTDNELVAKEVTVADYNAKAKEYDNLYLKFVDVTPDAGSVGATATQVLTFTQSGSELTVYNRSSWTAGKDIVIENLTGTLYGFAQYYNAPQVVPTTAEDLAAFKSPCELSRTSVSFTADGGEESVSATLTEGYSLGEVTDDAEWLAVSKSGSEITLTAEKNTDAAQRTASVSVPVTKGGDTVVTCTIEVSQKAAGSSGATKTYTLTFTATTMQENVSAYTKTWETVVDDYHWSIANFNNNNRDWNYIKCGRKDNASVATITTSWAIEEAIEKVIVTVDSTTASSVNSTKLEVATDASFTQNLQTVELDIKTGDMTYNVPKPAENCYYRLTYDCASASKNGIVQISKVVYTNE